jgi:hypothetical protein
MKKLALILALIIIPCSAFGLEVLSDTTLDNVTGQAGVNIAMDDVQIFMNIDKIAWIDCDGFSPLGRVGCFSKGGAIVLNNFQMDVININAIVDTIAASASTTDGQFGNGANLGLHSTTCGKIPLFYNYASTASPGCGLSSLAGGQTKGMDNFSSVDGSLNVYGTANAHRFTPQFLSIDVADALPTSTEGLRTWNRNAWTSQAVALFLGDSASTIGGVFIGLPTMEIYIQDMSFEPLYDGDLVSGRSYAINDDNHTWDWDGTSTNGTTEYASYGVIQMHNITFTLLSGWVEIAPK